MRAPCFLLWLTLPVTLASLLAPTPAPLPFRHSHSLISIFKRQASIFPEQCQTTCAYFVSVYTACTTNQTASCLAVCSTPNLNSLVVCVNCAYKTYENPTYEEWKTLYGTLSAIETTCADAGRSATATEKWEQWTPSGSSINPITTSPGPSPTPQPPTTSSKSTPIGAIVGGVVGGVALLAALLFLFLFLRRRRRHRNQQDPTERPIIQRSRSSQDPKFDIDPAPQGPEMISPFTASPLASSSTAPSSPATAYDRPMPAIPDFPLENPHALPPGAGSLPGKAQPQVEPEEIVEYRRHVDAGPSPGPESTGSQRHTVVDLPPEYQNARA